MENGNAAPGLHLMKKHAENAGIRLEKCIFA
jgi:hypothetical protein